MIEPGDRLYLSRTARYVRAKAVYLTDRGEVESEDWCEPIAVQIDIDEPLPVSGIRMEDERRVVFEKHPDPRVNSYIIETTDDPSDSVAPLNTYSRRIIKEGAAVVAPPQDRLRRQRKPQE